MTVQAPSHVICPMALQSVREILVDTVAATKRYSDMRVIEALRGVRQTVLFRNPFLSGVVPFAYSSSLFMSGRLPITQSDYWDAMLIPEPGLRAFQARPYLRNWDSLTPPTLYKYGVTQTVTTDYSVNYPEGRVTFTADVNDYEPVEASFCYYNVYKAAYQCLAGRMATNRTLVSWKEQDGTEEHYGSVKEALGAMRMLVQQYSRPNIPFGGIVR